MSFSVAIPLIILAGAIAFAIGWRSHAARRLERVTLARLPVGEGGIVTGGGPISEDTHGGSAVLLLHGFGDTPQTLKYLADDLVLHGYSVRAPLLPGHGRTLASFAESRSEEWLESARKELAAVLKSYADVSIVGLSMGGALASILAAEHGEISALVLISPYLDMPPAVRRVARWHRALGASTVYVAGRGGERSIHDPEERARALSYRASTPRLLFELSRIADAARASLPRISAPTLLLQSREDNRISPAVAEQAFAALGSLEKQLIWLEGCGHVVTVDYGRERVFAKVREWLEVHPGRSDSSRDLSQQEMGMKNGTA
ncbi:MAG: alpha/beta fold hydrolase [Gemmatimonadaceae bacterium]|nr:alpha/beta fold hydrolase [Gemmatimonadaceae bacterium]MDQ3519999.1 alpha/beta fold hydrolase [Gemmatimonadota bacterium]